MGDLEEIKKKKLEDLKQTQLNQTQQQPSEEEQLKQQVQQLEALVKQSFTKEALERYGNLKTAYPERTVQLLVVLAQALQSGQLTNIDDITLKEILKKISPEKKDIKIKRA
jgi:programmed cell death protein 5